MDTTRYIASACLLLSLVGAHETQAADKKQLSAALSAVEANLKTPAGKQYDADLGKQLSLHYADAIRNCKQAASGQLEPFDIFLKFKDDGKVEEALAYPETLMAVCTRDALSKAQFSPPPHGEYWINIHLELKK